MRPSDLRTARAVAPPTLPAIELELLAQHDAAYLKPYPVHVPLVTGLEPPGDDYRSTLLPGSEMAGVPPVCNAQAARDVQALQLGSAGWRDAGSRPMHQQFCDGRLNQLKIGYWTKAPVSDELAATLISFYLETGHATMGFFDVDLFLRDLTEHRQDFCSAFLVSALLCLACVSTSGPLWPSIC